MNLHSILTISFVNLVIVQGNDEYFSIDKSDWIEPGNMFEERKPVNYPDDESAISNNCQCSSEPVKVAEDCSAIKKELILCEKEIKSLKSLLNSKSCGYRASAFFKRIALKTVSKIDQLMINSQNLDTGSCLYLHIDISEKDLSILQQFKLKEAAEECSFIEKVDKVATRLIDSAYIGSKPSFWAENHDYIIGTIITICIGYSFIIRRGYWDKFILLIIVGTLWEWKRMYQMEITKRILSVSPECSSGREVDWTRSLANWFTGFAGSIFSFQHYSQRSDNVCSLIAVNPILDVNPVEAFSHVLSLIFFRPLVQLGDYSGMATTKFFAHIPIAYIPLILPSALFIIALVVMGIFRYSLKLPFVMIAPSTGPRTITHIHHSSGHPLDSGDRPPHLPSSSSERMPLQRQPRSPEKKSTRFKQTIPRSHSLGDFNNLVRRRNI